MLKTSKLLSKCLRYNLVIITGHGCYYKSKASGSKFKVPKGSTVTLWCNLGGTVDDESVGQLLDRGCTSSAFYKLKARDKKTDLPLTYYPGELVPNLILTPPDGLKPGKNICRDTVIAFPETFSKETAGAELSGLKTVDMPVFRAGKKGILRATSLSNIVKYSKTRGPGCNYHWAACTQEVTRRKQWNAQFQNISMIKLAVELFTK